MNKDDKINYRNKLLDFGVQPLVFGAPHSLLFQERSTITPSPPPKKLPDSFFRRTNCSLSVLPYTLEASMKLVACKVCKRKLKFKAKKQEQM